MDDAFLAALFPGRWAVLGHRLRPYCYGHVASLLAAGSPFVSGREGGGAWASAGDLIFALRICSAPGWPVPEPYGFRPRLRDAFLRWRLERRPVRLQAAVDAFRAYQDAHASFPTFYSNEATNEDDEVKNSASKNPHLSAPFLLARICSLISSTTITEARAWQMSLALPSWYGGTLAEMGGQQVRFLSESDDEETDLPADVDQMDDESLYRQAVEHLGEAQATEWLAARRVAKSEGGSHVG